MAVYKINQRVRIVDSFHAPHVIGHQGTVISELMQVTDFMKGDKYDGYCVEVDGIGIKDWDGVEFCFPPDCLVPLQYDGNTKVEWKECEWDPSMIKETA